MKNKKILHTAAPFPDDVVKKSNWGWIWDLTFMLSFFILGIVIGSATGCTL